MILHVFAIVQLPRIVIVRFVRVIRDSPAVHQGESFRLDSSLMSAIFTFITQIITFVNIVVKFLIAYSFFAPSKHHVGFSANF